MWRLAAIALIVMTAPAWAADWYCDASWGGTESGTEAEPYNTIGEAIAAASNLDTIYAKGGTDYAEAVTFSNLSIAIIGYTTTITDGGQAVIDATGETTGIAANCTTGNTPDMAIELQNLRVENATADGVLCNRTTDTAHAVVRNCVFVDNGDDGFEANHSSFNVTAYGCAFVSNGDYGATGVTRAYRCFSGDNADAGFIMFGIGVYVDCVVVRNAEGFDLRTAGTVVAGCVADNNSSMGFSLVGGSISDCIATNNGGYGYVMVTSAVGLDCVAGAGGLANTSGATSLASGAVYYDGTTVSTDPYVSIYNTDAWSVWDYSIINTSGLYMRAAPVGAGQMDSYDSPGPNDGVAPGGGGTTIIIVED